jgi:hypothetical protein
MEMFGKDFEGWKEDDAVTEPVEAQTKEDVTKFSNVKKGSAIMSRGPANAIHREDCLGL